jgi:hypothetical protein
MSRGVQVGPGVPKFEFLGLSPERGLAGLLDIKCASVSVSVRQVTIVWSARLGGMARTPLDVGVADAALTVGEDLAQPGGRRLGCCHGGCSLARAEPRGRPAHSEG